MSLSIAVAIPTFQRGELLVATIEALLRLARPPDEMVIADQSPEHSPEVEAKLRELESRSALRWLRFAEPSIPRSMNAALIEARSDLVLFLDDDIVPGESLVEAHVRAYDGEAIAAVAGQVLQPGEEVVDGELRCARSGLLADLQFPFNHARGALVSNVMAGNLSVRRTRAIEIGGFDENFTGAAYRFETDFARRLIAAGGMIRYEPRASIRHLKANKGGLRTFGDHLRVASPVHTTGDYYFAFLNGRVREIVPYLVRRMRKSILTRYHLRHPWRIPAKVVSEVRGLLAARELVRAGRRLLPPGERASRALPC
ncbi:MAG TPA: glycosyltransferase [Thermoanaerobaculia bacterium]|nr:glycosyltransferase [Thermoanaerobaculia bacterium]